MSITPTTEVNIWVFDGTTKPVKLVTLMAWSVALKSEANGYQVSGQLVEPIVRKFLGCPPDYPLAEISEHISMSYESVKEQL